MPKINRHTMHLLLEKMPFIIKYPIDFRIAKNHWPRLHNKDYSDYIFWDNYWGRHNKHAYLADKYEVRKYVEGKGLSGILTNLYGCWDDASKINFDELPNQFALKSNHSCGMNIICYDKSKLDLDEVRAEMNAWLHTKHPIYFERHYNKIKPLIICEELIPNNKNGFFPVDYKIHCAHGTPVYIQCCFERSTSDAGRRVIYSPKWENMHFVLEDTHYSDEEMDKPTHLSEMLKYATVLSKDLDYARVDFYDTDDRVIFGEITLTPMGGMLSYFKQEALDMMGQAIRNKQ